MRHAHHRASLTTTIRVNRDIVLGSFFKPSEIIKTFSLPYLIRSFHANFFGYLDFSLPQYPEVSNFPSPFIFPCVLPHHLLQSNSGRSLLLWERCEAQVWLYDLHLWEQLLGLWALDAGVHNHVITWHPVDWSGDAVLVAGLEGVDDAEDFGGVAAGGRRVGEN